MVADSADDLTWQREERPVWDADKARIIGGAPSGAFVVTFDDGEELPGEWWSASDSTGDVVGFGRLDTTWGGDAEILLAVAPDRQEGGVGSFILDRLDDEAAGRGINYLRNRIRDHARRDVVHDWLVVRGFRGPVDGDLSRRVGRSWRTAPRSAHEPAEPYDVRDDASDQAPGHEEQGGYVDVEDHSY